MNGIYLFNLTKIVKYSLNTKACSLKLEISFIDKHKGVPFECQSLYTTTTSHPPSPPTVSTALHDWKKFEEYYSHSPFNRKKNYFYNKIQNGINVNGRCPRNLFLCIVNLLFMSSTSLLLHPSALWYQTEGKTMRWKVQTWTKGPTKTGVKGESRSDVIPLEPVVNTVTA